MDMLWLKDAIYWTFARAFSLFYLMKTNISIKKSSFFIQCNAQKIPGEKYNVITNVIVTKKVCKLVDKTGSR